MISLLKNIFGNAYKNHSEAIVISCFFNPQNSPYRTKAFNEYYKSIKHLNHHIVECVIGDSKPELPENKNISRIYTNNLLWHKESLLNNIITKLPQKYKYIFWIDADVIFTNRNWLVDGVNALKKYKIIQPFEYCVHLNKDEFKPTFDVDSYKGTVSNSKLRHKQLWRSFCANHTIGLSNDCNYDIHGHVGFAWGAQRDVLEKVPLYDRALIGGADHIIAHAAAGQIPHNCITKSFTDNLTDVINWSKRFYSVINGNIGYVKGDLYHIWHGNIENRQYLKRIQDFTIKNKEIINKDKNGLYITNDKKDIPYIKEYFEQREVKTINDNFIESVAYGYMMNDGLSGGMLGGNMLGGMIGDMLNTNDENKTNHNQSDITNNYTDTETFS